MEKGYEDLYITGGDTGRNNKGGGEGLRIRVFKRVCRLPQYRGRSVSGR